MRSRILVSLLTVGTLVLGNPVVPVLAGKMDGISYLVAVTQLKTDSCGIEDDDCSPPPPPPPPPKKPAGSKKVISTMTFNADAPLAFER